MKQENSQELNEFESALAKVLTADPSLVKAAMEQEKKERAEERKAKQKEDSK